MNPALRYPHYAGGKLLSQPKRRLQIDFKRPQIARIHANQIASRVQRALQLVSIMHFTQNIQPPASSLSRKQT
jgi:hypothetical protein